jgi:uncharacterized protein
MKMRKKALVCALALCLGLLLCGFDSERQKVYDNSGLFTEEERNSLEQECRALAEQEKIDIIILTQDEADSREPEEIADDFYDEMGFGYEGPHETGIILPIDMYHRKYTVTTSGYAIEWYTDREIEKIYDAMEDSMREGDYYEACLAYLDQADRLKNNSERAENGYYDPGTQTFVSTEKGPVARAFTAGRVLLRLVLSAVIALAGVWMMRRQTKPRMTVGRSTYLKDNRVTVNHQADRFTHETVVTRQLPKPPPTNGGGGGGFSSSHTSGGGFSHGGGGGRSF